MGLVSVVVLLHTRFVFAFLDGEFGERRLEKMDMHLYTFAGVFRGIFFCCFVDVGSFCFVHIIPVF